MLPIDKAFCNLTPNILSILSTNLFGNTFKVSVFLTGPIFMIVCVNFFFNEFFKIKCYKQKKKYFFLSLSFSPTSSEKAEMASQITLIALCPNSKAENIISSGRKCEAPSIISIPSLVPATYIYYSKNGKKN